MHEPAVTLDTVNDAGQLLARHGGDEPDAVAREAFGDAFVYIHCLALCWPAFGDILGRKRPRMLVKVRHSSGGMRHSRDWRASPPRQPWPIGVRRANISAPFCFCEAVRGAAGSCPRESEDE